MSEWTSPKPTYWCTHLCSGRTGWFRIMGFGLIWKHDSSKPLFSERYGYKRYLHLPGLPYRIGYLTPWTSG